MHMKARGKLAASPTKSEADDIIERIRQMEAAAILRGGAPDALIGTSVGLAKEYADLN